MSHSITTAIPSHVLVVVSRCHGAVCVMMRIDRVGESETAKGRVWHKKRCGGSVNGQGLG
jgi:hypothetical protein